MRPPPRAKSGLCAIALRIVFGDFAEEGGLLGDLRAVAYQNDLRVGGIEVAARGGQHIIGGERMNFLAIGFQMIFGQAVEINRGELTEQAVLRSNSQREHAGQIAARAFQFFGE